MSLEDSADALEEVSYRFHLLANAKTVYEQAEAYIALANAMSDLESHHPNYDDRTGRCWKYEEELEED